MLTIVVGCGALTMAVALEARAAWCRRREWQRLAALRAEAEAALREARLNRLALEAMVRAAPAPREQCRN